MALSKDDKEWIKLIAKDVAFAVNKEVLKEHIGSCPYGKKMLIARAAITGLCVGIGAVGGWKIFGLGITKLLTVL